MAVLTEQMKSPKKSTAVPAISECLWRASQNLIVGGMVDRSPRDFRVLVAGGRGGNANTGNPPQSPRFQSACGGSSRKNTWAPHPNRSPRDFRVLVAAPVCQHSRITDLNRSPRDFRVLVADIPTLRQTMNLFTAVPAISECLWRHLHRIER